jgi:hypothetical protein
MIRWLLDQLFGKTIAVETDRYLQDLTMASESASRQATEDLLQRLRAGGPLVKLGETTWGKPVEVSLEELVKAHSLITGASGVGKTIFELLIIRALLENGRRPFIVVDPKGDSFAGALFLVGQQIERLARSDPKAAEVLKQRLHIFDLASTHALSGYNILKPWPDVDLDYFALNRADVIADVLDRDQLSLGGVVLLQKLIMLLASADLPITYLGEVLHNDPLRSKMLRRCQNERLTQYFTQQFATVPKATIAALERRMEALLASEGMRLALAGQSAPDFRRIQDESGIMLANLSGASISRSARLFWQRLIVSDLRHGVFARRTNHPVWVALDEGQNLFTSVSERENLTDQLTMSRSFGTFLCFLTQNASTAVRDERILKILHTNIGWSFSMRSEPSDCAFLKPALPAFGRKQKPAVSPFDEPAFFTPDQERSLALEEMTHLPAREGYLWLKARNAQAFRIRTAELQLPQGPELAKAIHAIRADAEIGQRLTKSEYERHIAERDGKWREEPRPLKASLEQKWQKQRGKDSEAF